MDVIVEIEDPQRPGERLFETARVLALMHHPADPQNIQAAIEWYSGYAELQRLTDADVQKEWRLATCQWLEPFHPTIAQIYPTTIMDVVSLACVRGAAHVFELLPDQEMDMHRVYVRDSMYERLQNMGSWL